MSEVIKIVDLKTIIDELCWTRNIKENNTQLFVALYTDKINIPNDHKYFYHTYIVYKVNGQYLSKGVILPQEEHTQIQLPLKHFFEIHEND